MEFHHITDVRGANKATLSPSQIPQWRLQFKAALSEAALSKAPYFKKFIQPKHLYMSHVFDAH